MSLFIRSSCKSSLACHVHDNLHQVHLNLHLVLEVVLSLGFFSCSHALADLMMMPFSATLLQPGSKKNQLMMGVNSL